MSSRAILVAALAAVLSVPLTAHAQFEGDLVLLPDGCQASGDEARRNLVEARLQPRLLTNSIDATLDAAIQGFGIARLFSYHVAGAIAAGKLVQVLNAKKPERIPVNIVFQANRQQSPNLKAFLADARKSLLSCPDL